MNATKNESQNFFRNVYFLAVNSGRGITDVELSAGMCSGYCSIGLTRNSSPTLRTAKRFADVLGYTIDELMMDPKEFRKQYGEVHD